MSKSIDFPTKVRDIHFLGIVNYYRDMRPKHAHTLYPLTKLCSTKVNFKWTDVENNTFVSIKKKVGRDVLLYYPNFSEKFIIHTDARNTHLRVIISQNVTHIAFYSRKLTPSQISYMMTEK